MREQLFFEAIFVYIIARIITKEIISSWWREYLLKRSCYYLHELFSCPFCLSFWISCVMCYATGSNVWFGYRITFYMLITSFLDSLLEALFEARKK